MVVLLQLTRWCQKDITQTIIEHDANYIIAIKENQKKNYQPAKQIIDYYQDRDEIINRVIRHVSENAGHGRIEKRTCTVVSYGSIMEKMFKKKLVGLKSVVGIKSERTIVATGEYTQEVRDTVASLIIPNLRRLHLPSGSIGLLGIIFIGNWMLPFEKTTVKR